MKFHINKSNQYRKDPKLIWYWPRITYYRYDGLKVGFCGRFACWTWLLHVTKWWDDYEMAGWDWDPLDPDALYWLSEKRVKQLERRMNEKN